MSEDKLKTKKQLIDELVELRGEIARLEGRGKPPSTSSSNEQPSQMLNTLLELLPFGVSLVLGRTIVFANPALLSMYGSSEEELIGKTPSDFLKEGEALRVAERLQELQAGGRVYPSEYTCLRTDGSPFPVEITSKFIEWEEEQALLSVHQDLTEYRRTAEALRETHETLKALIEACPMGIFTLDSDAQVVKWSRSAEKIFGWNEEEVLGGSPPQVPDDELEDLRKRVKLGHAADGHEVSRLRRDGSVVDLEAWSAPIRDADGNFIGNVVLSADITDRKRLEREILEVSAREQSRIGQDLHDGLGQRLAGIAFLSKAVAQKLSAQASPESAATAEIAQLVTQAMTQARHLARGLYPVALEVGGLMAALDEMSANMKRLFGVSCVVEAVDCLSPSEEATARHLYYVVQEAVTNAIKHGQAKNVVVQLERTGDKCMLSVRDDGTGLSADARSSKGMGLHIMRYRANMIHASFIIKSAPKGGTIVRLAWPWTETGDRHD